MIEFLSDARRRIADQYANEILQIVRERTDDVEHLGDHAVSHLAPMIEGAMEDFAALAVEAERVRLRGELEGLARFGVDPNGHAVDGDMEVDEHGSWLLRKHVLALLSPAKETP